MTKLRGWLTKALNKPGLNYGQRRARKAAIMLKVLYFWLAFCGVPIQGLHSDSPACPTPVSVTTSPGPRIVNHSNKLDVALFPSIPWFRQRFTPIMHYLSNLSGI